MRNIVTAGTVVGKNEKKYVWDAVSKMGDPDHFKDYVYKFEEAFAKRVGSKYAFAVVNGTAAMHLGLLAMGIGKGDEVIVPDLGYISAANVVTYVGAKPVFADIDPINWCLYPGSVKKRITKKTKAIMPVWMYGSVPNMEGLMELGIPIIEDSCPALGSYYCEKHAGTFGEVGCFSFQGAKVTSTGEGGMLVTDSDKINAKVRKLADMGITKQEFFHDEIGYMYEMSPILAAVGLGQLEHADRMIAQKVKIFEIYYKALRDSFGMNYFDEWSSPNMWMSSILADSVKQRNQIREHLKKNKIDTRPFFYPQSMFGLYKGNWKNPVSYDIGLRGINLPSRVDLTKKEVDYVIKKIQEVI